MSRVTELSREDLIGVRYSTEGDTVVHLFVARVRPDPSSVGDHDVPVPFMPATSDPRSHTDLDLIFHNDESHLDPYADWDLTTSQVSTRFSCLS